MKWVLIPLFVLTFLFVNNLPANAAGKAKNAAPSISASGQFVKARNVVRANFSKIKGVSKITYVLTYIGNGNSQGVEGSFVPGKRTSFSKDIYLGTCSRKVCVQHRNVKNLQLQVTTKFTNGKSSSKTYKVK